MVLRTFKGFLHSAMLEHDLCIGVQVVCWFVCLSHDDTDTTLMTVESCTFHCQTAY